VDLFGSLIRTIIQNFNEIPNTLDAHDRLCDDLLSFYRLLQMAANNDS